MQESKALMLIKRAQQGDGEAHRQVALYVFERYSYRVTRLFSQDPAITMDDMLSTFFEGIFRAIPELDHRGNPLYHAGQRGIWNLHSELRAVANIMKRRSFQSLTEPGMDGLALEERIADRTEVDFREVVTEQIDANLVIRIAANTSLKTRVRQAMDIMLSGAAGDPEEPGYNQRLAAEMGISPQRASQVTRELQEVLSSEMEIEERYAELRVLHRAGDRWTSLS